MIRRWLITIWQEDEGDHVEIGEEDGKIYILLPKLKAERKEREPLFEETDEEEEEEEALESSVR